MTQLIRTASHWGVYDAEVEGGVMTGVRPVAQDTDPSPLIHAMPGVVRDRTRIAQPMVRESWLARGAAGSDRARRGGEPFVPVSWDRALGLVAGELDRVRRDHGNAAIYGGSYGWASAGRFHAARDQTQRFLNTIGGYTGSVLSYSYGAGLAIAPHVVGTAACVTGTATAWPVVAQNAKLVVAFGGMPLKNAQIDHGGTAEHGFTGFLKSLRDNGVDVVLVSPCRDDLPDWLGAAWLPIRPNTDTALMLALAHTLVSEGRHDRAFLSRYTVGFEKFAPYLTGETDGVVKDADWAAPICEIPAETIRALARRMASVRTMINSSWSVQRGDHGEQPYWMTVVLAALLGQVGLPGGGFTFGYGAVAGVGIPRPRVPRPGVTAGVNPVKAFIPVSRVTDMLLSPGETIDFNGQRITYPDIRLVYWAGGNVFHHHQDINRLLRAWQRPETIVVHEPFWTPMARHADIVLPATLTLERNDIGAASLDRWLIAMKRVVAPYGEARNDYDIYAGLAERLGAGAAYTEGRDEMGWLRHLYDVVRQQAARGAIEMPSFDDFWAAGELGFAAPEKPFVLFEDFRDDPDGAKLATPSGRIEIFSERIAGFGYDDCPGHPAWMPPVEWLGAPSPRFPLHLLSNQPRTRLHSQLDQGSVSRASKIKGREPVRLNPADAAARGIQDGDVVRVFNDRGACLAGAALTEDVRPGVVVLPTGAWYDPAESGRIGALDRHGSVNVLTRDAGTSKLSQMPVAQSALVEVERWDGALPGVGAFEPPAVVQG